MSGQERKTGKRVLNVGLLAHVDAGKTTLSESILYQSGAIRNLGRVDHQDAFLDTDEMERERGITIFSKQAVLTWKDTEITLLDTPGHVDFSAEMERVLQVLDCAVLVISGADGVQGHTETLWKLLTRYGIPVFLFVNKMDQEGTDCGKLLAELKSRFSEGCIDFGRVETGAEEVIDEIGMHCLRILRPICMKTVWTLEEQKGILLQNIFLIRNRWKILQSVMKSSWKSILKQEVWMMQRSEN